MTTISNSSLIMGLVLQYLRKQQPDLEEYDRRHVKLCIYEQTGAACYFVRANAAIKWYYDQDPMDDHFSNCDLADVEEAINAGGRVQIVGKRGESYGLWRNWQDFVKEIFE